MRKIITITLSIFVTGLAIIMAVVSAGQRADAQLDRWLLAGVSVVIVLSAHMLPALLHGRSRLVSWPVWSLCLVLAVYGHASWFHNAAESAAEARQAGSSAARAVSAERQQIEQTLSASQARPTGIIARQLSRTTDEDRREALTIELAAARRADALRDRLVTLAGNAPGTSEEQEGRTRDGQGLVRNMDARMTISVLAAMLVEVLGMVLWREALAGGEDAEKRAETAQTVVSIAEDPDDSELAALRSAIARGECRTTVKSIQKYMRCGGDKASHLRRQLLAG